MEEKVVREFKELANEVTKLKKCMLHVTTLKKGPFVYAKCVIIAILYTRSIQYFESKFIFNKMPNILLDSLVDVGFYTYKMCL